MRLAVYGTVLLLAGGVYALKAGKASSSPKRADGRELGGRTSEGWPARAVVVEGKVVLVHMRWNMTCDHRLAPRPSGIGFGEDYGDKFIRRGRDFSVSGFATQKVDARWSLRYGGGIQGTLAADGKSATGTSWAHEDWYSGGRLQASCSSRTVDWSAAAG